MQQGIMRRKQQERFSSKSLPLAMTVVIMGLIVGMMTVSAPSVVVFVLADNIQGTSGDDTLKGTPEADTIQGFEGNDKLFGEAGNDTLDGDRGNDEMQGGDGNDEIKDGNNEAGEINKVHASSGNDNIDVGTVDGTGISYYIYGETGSDYIEVIANEVYVDGGLDDDTIYCTAQYCAIDGNEGHDEIHIDPKDTANYAYGGSGNDEIYSTGAGELRGNDGNDYLYGAPDMHGGEGDDVLEGVHPWTQYYGGAGADTFKCSSTWQHETVHDYNPGEGDQIVSAADCETVEYTAPSSVEITQEVDKKGSEIIDGGTTNSRYIKITFNTI
jgi:Ca2+-binding RTX toxin-like protein